MAVVEYSDLWLRITQLSHQQKAELLVELTNLVRKESRANTHSIMELEGLGEEIWAGIDAQEYVDQERNFK